MKKSRFVTVSVWIFFCLILFSWVWLIRENPDLFSVFNSKNKEFLFQFVRQLFGEGAKRIAYMETESWKEVLYLAYQTVIMSILATRICCYWYNYYCDSGGF